MRHDRLFKTGAIGSVIAALCCATPVLAVLLGAIGLGWMADYTDYVVLPVLGLCLGLIGYALWHSPKSVRRTVHREGDDHETSA